MIVVQTKTSLSLFHHMFILFIPHFFAAENLLLGIPPSLHSNYTLSIDSSASTFTCLDGSHVIPLSKFNDNYRDCPDGSDEPGTSDGPSFDFFCQNSGYSSQSILRWSVGDGICDCCDGSDEHFTSGNPCADNCTLKKSFHERLLGRLISEYEKGLKKLAEIRVKGQEKLKESAITFVRTKSELRRLIRRKKGIEASPAYPTPTPIPEGEVEGKLFEPPEFSYWRRLFLKVWQVTFLVRDDEQPFLLEMVSEENRTNMADEIQSEIWRLETERDNAKVIVEGRFPPEWVLSYNERYAIGNDEIWILNEVKQNGYPAGRYQNVTSDGMLFTEGSYCWEVKKSKATKMKLECGTENALLRFNEPKMCEYEAVFVSPAGCSQEKIERLKGKSLEELEGIALDLNLL
jgi:hypothetical protein